MKYFNISQKYFFSQNTLTSEDIDMKHVWQNYHKMP